MDEMWILVKDISSVILPHWAFLTWVCMTMVIGQVTKALIWTKERALKPSRAQAFWYWGYKSMSLHGAAAGMFLIAPMWESPAPDIDLMVERMAYFGLAGLIGVALYRVLKELAAKRGIDITLPGLEEEQQKAVLAEKVTELIMAPTPPIEPKPPVETPEEPPHEEPLEPENTEV